MSSTVETERTVKALEIDPAGPIAKDIAEAVADEWAERDSHTIQSIWGDGHGIHVTHEVVDWQEILAAARKSLREHGHDDLPDDLLDGPGVLAVNYIDISVNDTSTLQVAIEQVVDSGESGKAPRTEGGA